MLCPHCSQSLKYKERSGNTCSGCYKYFAFEPKTHPLQLSDTYFSKIINKHSNRDKLFYTSQQLQFAVSRKKVKSKSSIVALIIVAVITTIFALFISPPAAIAVILFWIVLIITKIIYSKKYVSLPQMPQEFESEVINCWKSAYKTYPSKLITKHKLHEDFNHNLNGILICEDYETAMCLSANEIDKKLHSAIVADPNKITELLQKRANLTVYVLHGASIDGYEFFEKVKRRIGRQARVINIGLRPQAVMKSQLMKFREKSGTTANFNNLTSEENAWLNKGYYTPLFVLKPENLIKYVTNQITRKSKIVSVNDAEKTAKNIGFMTWVNE